MKNANSFMDAHDNVWFASGTATQRCLV